MPLKIKSTSGSVTLEAENVSGDTTLTVPSGTATLATKENFTSTGIDDNATSTKQTITDSATGIGVAPKTWAGGINGLQFGNCGAMGSWSGNTVYNNNAYYSNGWKYITTNESTMINHNSAGDMLFQTAPSGAADAAITYTTAMTIANDGIVTTPYQPAFSAYLSSSQSINQSSTLLVALDTKEFDIGNNFNTSTNRFVAPVAGRYLFSVAIQYGVSSPGTAHTNIFINGGGRNDGWIDFGDAKSAVQSRVLDLNANDYVQLYAHINPAGSMSGQRTRMTGFLIG